MTARWGVEMAAPATPYAILADPAECHRLWQEHGTIRGVARAVGCHPDVARKWLERAGILRPDQRLPPGPKPKGVERPVPPPEPEGDVAARLVQLLRRQPYTIEQLADALDRAPSRVRAMVEDLRAQGYAITETPYGALEITAAGQQEAEAVQHADDADVFRIALIADTHLCSTHQQLTALQEFYRRAADAGCRRVYHAGDMIAGERVYSGQQYDLFLVGHDNQVGYVVEHYPRDLPTTFITGNHDLAYLKSAGIDPGRAIARERSDMEYIGQWARRVEIAPGIFLDLTHGAGGVAYAISYRLQKAIEAYAPGDEPHILCDGHYHVMLQVLRRGVWAYHPGCFEGQTALLRRLKVHPVIGGWILTIHVDEPGRIGAIESRFIQFGERERDY